MANRAAPEGPSYAAVFVDFENVYYFLKNHFHDPPDLNDYVLALVRKLREDLATRGLDCLVLNAYADFERLATAPQGGLYLMGVSTRNVLGTHHKNAADMQLCIDAMEVLYTRPDIGTFVLVAGDRDYIPLLQHLRRQARQVLVAGFREATSGDLLQNLGPQHFLDARELLPPATLALLEARRRGRPAPEAAAPAPARAAGAAAVGAPAAPAPADAEAAPAFDPVRPLTGPDELRCLAFMVAELLRLSQHRPVNELWLTPFLRRLTDEFPALPEYERRDLLNGLRTAGALRIEKREGEQHPFSVIVLNPEHPDVRALAAAGAA
ncbi:NYN domain-containing protein [Hymenobacter nivis]|uniref:NYN domain-containing protein n=1 Tax=Hymenobacter nivis TaxID=1850093 RepID=A0A502H2H3_9BACT|nr:NYN domain-containing protein [Hymenobacter nivis]TPG67540.1 NYN domain-containing protein [Hymenobacter nivis]